METKSRGKGKETGYPDPYGRELVLYRYHNGFGCGLLSLGGFVRNQNGEGGDFDLILRRPGLPEHHPLEQFFQALRGDAELQAFRQKTTAKLQIIPVIAQKSLELLFGGCHARVLKQFDVCRRHQESEYASENTGSWIQAVLERHPEVVFRGATDALAECLGKSFHRARIPTVFLVR